MDKSSALIPKAIFLWVSFVIYSLGMANISASYNNEKSYQDSLSKLRLSPKEKAEKAIRMDIFHVVSKRAPQMNSRDRWRLTKAVDKYSKLHRHDPYLLLAVIEIESAYRHDAVSHKGAVGYMQLRPFVARAIALEADLDSGLEDFDLTDLDTNVRLGSYYLSKMKRKFGDLNLALVAYNLGPTRLNSYLKKGKKPNMKYTIKVLSSRRKLLRLSPMTLAGKDAA